MQVLSHELNFFFFFSQATISLTFKAVKVAEKIIDDFRKILHAYWHSKSTVTALHNIVKAEHKTV